MSLLRFAITRVLSGGLLVVASVIAVFLMMRTLGNPIAIALAGRVSEEEIALRTEAAGLNRPILEQMFEYLSRLFSGSLGETTLSGQDVGSIVGIYLPASVEFGALVLLVSASVAIPIGYLAARNQGKLKSQLIRVSAIVLYAAPVFLLAVILKVVFTVWIPLFPVAGRISVSSQIELEISSPNTGFIFYDSLVSGSGAVLVDYLWHLVLPVMAIGIIYASSIVRAVRSNLTEQMESDWYLEARNKFGDNQKTIIRHLIRPAAAPIITAFGSQAIVVLTGMIFAELVFEIRGLGFLLSEAVIARDYNLVQGVVVVIAIFVILINLVTDLVAAAIDPRFRKVVR